MFKRDSANFSVLKYNIDEDIAGAKNVSLYAEIHDKPEYPEDGAYHLNIFISIEPLAIREYVVGLIFGNKTMNQDAAFAFIDDIVLGQVTDNFKYLVKQILHDSQVLEQHPFIPE